jgi:hypothetical protein
MITTKTTYITSDGEEFETFLEAEEYEKSTSIKALFAHAIFGKDGGKRIPENCECDKGWLLDVCDTICLKDVDGIRILNQAFDDRGLCMPFPDNKALIGVPYFYNEATDFWESAEDIIKELNRRAKNVGSNYRIFSQGIIAEFLNCTQG